MNRCRITNEQIIKGMKNNLLQREQMPQTKFRVAALK